jgi:ABC transporter substrate-binding protein (ThiB subfamily)
VLVVTAVVLVVAAAGYGGYVYEIHLPPPGTTPLVIYTYASLFGGNCGSDSLSAVLAPFESAHHVTVSFQCPSDLLSTLLSERASPGADLVLGLDEVTAPAAIADGLLLPYRSTQLANVADAIVNELDPAHGVTPYEWGYLSIDYTPAFYNATGGRIAHSAFPDFSNNLTWAKGLLIEDPTADITGEEFLLWQIEFYTAVLHQDWTTWWKTVASSVPTAPDWATAFGEFSQAPVQYPTVVSYSSDSAYAEANGGAGSLGTAVTTWNGTSYGWRTVYGLGIVNGSAHSDLDRQFIDWFLGGTVQSAIPTNEWEYPANRTVPLPSSFASAIDPSTIVPLDDFTTPAAIAANLPTYLEQWQALENQYG